MAARAPSTPTLAPELREPLGRAVGRLSREGPASISDLAAAERMRPQSMAQTVRELENAGLVSRRADPADRRRAFVELTPAGAEKLQDTRAAREDWLAQTLDAELDAEEHELLRRAL